MEAIRVLPEDGPIILLASDACKRNIVDAYLKIPYHACYRVVDPIPKSEWKGLINMEKDKESIDRAAIASQGGLERARRLPAKRKAEIARAAADARWSQAFPSAVAEGEIDFAGRRIACAVLDTKLRVLTQETFLTTLGRAKKAKGGQGSRQLMKAGGTLPFVAAENLQQFISDDLRKAATPVVFRTARGGKAYGYDARLLPLVCEVYLLARDAHMAAMKEAAERRKRGEDVEAKPVLLPSQEPIVQTCDLLVRSMAREHIVALVDRATGYHDQEVRDEIAKILEIYIAPHLLPWSLRFPDQFFKLVYKIHGWNYVVGNRKMPQYIGKFINKYVYDELPEGVGEKLRDLNPVLDSGYRATQLHRHLTDTGNSHLDRQVLSLMTIMEVSTSKDEFKTLFGRVTRKKLGPPARVPLKLKAKSVDDLTLPLFQEAERIAQPPPPNEQSE